MRLQRLFFALWPDEAVLKKIVSTLSAVETAREPSEYGILVRPENFHLTLVFIGSAEQRYRECLHAAASKITASAFVLNLDVLGYFKKPRILWLGPTVFPQALMNLVSELNSRLSSCGYQPEMRAYAPHVTLFRQASPLQQAIALDAIEWHVRGFSLAESISAEGGVQYNQHYHYPLQ